MQLLYSLKNSQISVNNNISINIIYMPIKPILKWHKRIRKLGKKIFRI